MMRCKSFDYLRALCMLYIVGFWHLLDYLGRPEGQIYVLAEHGTFVVLSVFFMLSGYLNGADKNRDILAFYKTKVLRVYPLYVLALICFFLLGLNDGVTTLKALMGVSIVTGAEPVTLWFVAMLVLLYFLTPILIRVRTHKFVYFFGTSLVLVISSYISYKFGYVHENFCYYFPGYVIGIYLYTVGSEERYRTPLLLISFVVFVVALFVRPYVSFEVFASIVGSLAAFVIIILCLKYEIKFKSNYVIEYLALGSYVSYLFHRPVYELVEVYTGKDVNLASYFYYILALLLVLLLSGKVQKTSDLLLDKNSLLIKRIKFDLR